jgi:pimeloyl-ACP methyl ester carboxylesterase
MPVPAHVARRRLSLPASGVEIALLDWGGAGPLALLHHANGFCAAVWTLVAELLHPHFRVVAVDARGHGDSSRPEGRDAYRWDRFADDVVSVARVLAPESPSSRVALGIGHSFGGTAMIAAAAREPALFERLALVDPVVLPPPDAGVAAQARGRGGELAEKARRRRALFPSREEARASWSNRELFAAWDSRALDVYAREGLRERSDGQFELKCAPEVEATVFEASGAFDVFGLAPAVVAPTLFLWAARGNFPRALHEALAQRMQHARVEAVDAGHLAPMERPDLVAEAVLRFVREAST